MRSSSLGGLVCEKTTGPGGAAAAAAVMPSARLVVALPAPPTLHHADEMRCRERHTLLLIVEHAGMLWQRLFSTERDSSIESELGHQFLLPQRAADDVMLAIKVHRAENQVQYHP
jgi:hypothetical protein